MLIEEGTWINQNILPFLSVPCIVMLLLMPVPFLGSPLLHFSASSEATCLRLWKLNSSLQASLWTQDLLLSSSHHTILLEIYSILLANYGILEGRRCLSPLLWSQHNIRNINTFSKVCSILHSATWGHYSNLF